MSLVARCQELQAIPLCSQDLSNTPHKMSIQREPSAWVQVAQLRHELSKLSDDVDDWVMLGRRRPVGLTGPAVANHSRPSTEWAVKKSQIRSLADRSSAENRNHTWSPLTTR